MGAKTGLANARESWSQRSLADNLAEVILDDGSCFGVEFGPDPAGGQFLSEFLRMWARAFEAKNR